MDDLKLATEEELRQQYLDIEEAIDEYLAGLEPERFESPAMDYIFDDEHRRQQAINDELNRRGLVSMYDWKMAQYGGL